MPCDSSTNSNLEEYNEVLSVISNFCATHNVENCIIGGDLNTDMSRTKSGNSISLQNFMDEENLSLVFKETMNKVAYTYKGANNATSLIDHFIVFVSEDVTMLASDYFTLDSVDNLTDHVPLYLFLKCDVDIVTTKSVKAPTRSPVWGLASCHDIEQYQLKLDKMLQDSYPTLDMFLDHSESKLCLKKEYVSKFHDVIINAAHNAMDKHIPHTGDRKPKVIPGWDIEMDCARQSSLFWHSMWNEWGRKQSGIVYDIMKEIGLIIITNCERCVKISRIKLNCRSPRQCYVIAQQHIGSPPVQLVNITIIQRRWLLEHLEIPILITYFGGNITL